METIKPDNCDVDWCRHQRISVSCDLCYNVIVHQYWDFNHEDSFVRFLSNNLKGLETDWVRERLWFYLSLLHLLWKGKVSLLKTCFDTVVTADKKIFRRFALNANFFRLLSLYFILSSLLNVLLKNVWENASALCCEIISSTRIHVIRNNLLYSKSHKLVSFPPINTIKIMILEILLYFVLRIYIFWSIYDQNEIP